MYIFIIFLSLFVIRNFRSVGLKVGGITRLVAILMGKGAIKLKGEIGRKQHKGGKNAQPLINRWVNFNSLLLWHVSFLQISIYYDIRWSLIVVKAIYPLNFYSGSSVCPATVCIIFTRILNVILAS